MFDYIAWIIVCIICAYISLLMAMMSLNSIGTCNIGGVPNSFMNRLGGLLIIVVFFVMWYYVFDNAPFTLTDDKGL
jgi:hypothetical protein